MLVKDLVIKFLVDTQSNRLAKLKELHAPAVMIESLEKAIESWKAGNLVVGGKKALLSEECKSFQVKKGNGGKAYLEFDNGVKFFPQARYGFFISR